jgi:serine/threonine protein kinase
MDFSQGSHFGSYRILSLIGKGGMGKVYAAEDSRLHRKVALKVLPVEATQQPERVRRFEQEARAASALNHPNILTIYEVGQVESTHYISNELIEGDTLRKLVGSRLALRKVLDIAVQSCSALAAAHTAGIVHRDIKPENIMLRGDGYVKILDFGLAKLTEPPAGQSVVDDDVPTAMSDGLTVRGQILGTWLYMSPEQVRGKELDARTDIWSLGIVIYELLSGHSPFAANTATDTIVSIVDREPLPLSHFGVEVPEELERILGKALAKDREERYQSIKDMGLDLKQLSQEMELETVTRTTRVHTSMGRKAPPAHDRRTPAALSRSAIPAVIVLALAAIGWGAWTALHKRPTTSAPERQLTYSLLVQKMRGGKPFEDPFPSTGREIFENGWKFRFNFFSTQPGSLYLLDQGPGPDGRPVLTVLFPTPSNHNGVAQLAANDAIQTGWYVFDQHQGTEKFWIVWSAQPARELEVTARMVANPEDRGVIRDAGQSAKIQDLLARYSSEKPAVTTDKALNQTTILGSGDALASMVELEHH